MDFDKDWDTCNQTIFQFYGSYINETKNILKKYFFDCNRQIRDYFHENAQYIALALLVYIAFSICFYFCLTRTKLVRQMGEISYCKNVLFVTAHPDDECMFFGPTIINIISKTDSNVYILCLSRGNYALAGRKRKEELFNSVKILGVPESNIQVINSSLLPDDPTMTWSEEVVGNIILNFIEIYNIDTVITFDKYGVSNHPNHSSLFYAVAYLCLEKLMPKYCTPYALETVSKVRKYIAYFDLPLSFFLSSKIYIVPMDKRSLIRQAMEEHKSQYVWFRKAYMIFSRYIFINTLKEIDALQLELEFELDNT